MKVIFCCLYQSTYTYRKLLLLKVTQSKIELKKLADGRAGEWRPLGTPPSLFPFNIKAWCTFTVLLLLPDLFDENDCPLKSHRVGFGRVFSTGSSSRHWTGSSGGPRLPITGDRHCFVIEPLAVEVVLPRLIFGSTGTFIISF